MLSALPNLFRKRSLDAVYFIPVFVMITKMSSVMQSSLNNIVRMETSYKADKVRLIIMIVMIVVSGLIFLLVLAYLDCLTQNSHSRKMVVCVCVSVCVLFENCMEL